MAVMSVLGLKVRDGKGAELLETFKTVKRVVERAGGRYRVVRQVFGPNPNTVSSIAEFDDWSGLSKMRSDPEMQQLRARILQTATPAADPIVSVVVEEIPI